MAVGIAAVDIMVAKADMGMAAACLQAAFRRPPPLRLRPRQAWRVRHAALPMRLVRGFASNAAGP